MSELGENVGLDSTLHLDPVTRGFFIAPLLEPLRLNRTKTALWPDNLFYRRTILPLDCFRLSSFLLSGLLRIRRQHGALVVELRQGRFSLPLFPLLGGGIYSSPKNALPLLVSGAGVRQAHLGVLANRQ